MQTGNYKMVEILKNQDSESALENSTLKLFNLLGWETSYAENEVDGDPTLLGREHQGEVILKRYLLFALKKLNPHLPDESLHTAIEILETDRSTQSLALANHEVYSHLKNGIKVTIIDRDGNESIERVKIIDWQNPANNHFLMVSQLWVNGDPYRRRADLVGFTNGLPLLFIELKAPDKAVYNAYQDNLRDYKNTIPQIFWYNAFVILSNGSRAKVGSITAPWEHFTDWKKINDEGEEGIISLETLIRGTCAKDRFLDIVENFIVFQEASGGLRKLVTRNHQYLGVNNVIHSVDDLQNNKGKLGVFWHTQGSGKSASMIFFTQKVLRKKPGNWTFVIITDRQELDAQIYKTFVNSGIINEKQTQANSSKHLRQLLQEDHRYVFTLIHKFRTDNGEKHPVLSIRNDVIVITDEAHRSQYDTLAQNMRDALPNAAFIGFTGTPLIKTEQERTREVFGDYVSIYNFTQSIEDGATVPLYYENRIPEVQLTNEDLNDDMQQLLDQTMLDEAQEEKLEREFSRQYHIITRDDRLDKIGEDIVVHFMGRGHRGKAMVIAIDKATAVKLYDKVQKYWQIYINKLIAQVPEKRDDALIALKDNIEFMEQTDMAVVVSQGQNEVEDLRKKGVEILPHRKRMVKEDLDTKFKDPDDPFRIVFVCAMWMTGFDVPSCSTIYLDKPMRNHTLMQTIARANRVFQDKSNGLIVDYIGIFRSLEKALAIYGAPGEGEDDFPIKDKNELLAMLQMAVAEAIIFLEEKDVDINKILQTQNVFERTKLKDDAVEAILESEESKKNYLLQAAKVKKIYKAILPDPVDQKYREKVYIISKIASQIKSLTPQPNIDEVLGKAEELLDESIEGYQIKEPIEEFKTKLYDLSKIDFEHLKQRFERGRKRMQIEELKGSIEQKLHATLDINRHRIDYLERFQQLIDEYNAGAQSVDDIFKKLVEFAQDLQEEEKRHIREELGSEEELAVFDILTRPKLKMTKKEEIQVKSISRDLLKTLKTEKLVLDWRKKQQTRAAVKVSIAELLDQLPAIYDKPIFDEKCQLVYDYIYEHY